MGTMILRDVPDDLRKAFKLLCVERETNMTAELRRLMAEEVRRAEGRKRA